MSSSSTLLLLLTRCSIRFRRPPPRNAEFPSPSRNASAAAATFPSISHSLSWSTRTPSRVSCIDGDGKDHQPGLFEEFSVLPSDIPWNDEDIWSIFGAYVFILHVPLSFGGIALVSMLLRQPLLHPSCKVISAIVLQSVEFGCAMLLLNYTSKSQFGFSNIFKDQLISKRRSWLKASAAGLGSLFMLVLLTSFLADRLIGTKDVNDHILQEIIVSNNLSSKASSIFFCCFSTPLLEELVYRRFLMRSLTSTMKWHHAILISACVFSIAHFSFENSLQLFLIGSVLGAVYCWSGNLASSILVHSVYNAAILVVTSSI